MQDEIFKQILNELQEMNTDIKGIKTEFTEFKQETKKQLTRIDKRLENIENVVNKGVFEDLERLERRIEILEQRAV